MVFSVEDHILKIGNLCKCVKANGRRHLSICSDCLDLFLNVLSASWLLPDFTIWFWCLSLWMSVIFVACVTRYSRGAKNRCGGKYNTGFITIFLRCIIAKNYPNWPRIDKVIGKIKRVQFETQCSCLKEQYCDWLCVVHLGVAHNFECYPVGLVIGSAMCCIFPNNVTCVYVVLQSDSVELLHSWWRSCN